MDEPKKKKRKEKSGQRRSQKKLCTQMARTASRIGKLYATGRGGGERSVTKFDATTKGRSERR